MNTTTSLHHMERIRHFFFLLLCRLAPLLMLATFITVGYLFLSGKFILRPKNIQVSAAVQDTASEQLALEREARGGLPHFLSGPGYR